MTIPEFEQNIFNNRVTKKSIFKQATYRNLYKFETMRRINNFSYGYEYLNTIDKSKEIIEDEILHTCNLELPVLSKGDKFYIVELDRTVSIQEAIRASDNSYMYICDGVYIDDEKSLKSKAIAETQKQLYLANEEAKKELKKIKEHWLIGKLIKFIK